MMFALVTLFTFETGLVVWTSAIAFFVLDLYTTSTPFGLTLFAGTISVLLGYWFHTRVFTNRSWWAATALTIITLAIYRLGFIMGLFILEVLTSLDVRWSDLFINILWEILMTAILVGLSIFTLSFFIRSLRTKTVEKGLFVIRRPQL